MKKGHLILLLIIIMMLTGCGEKTCLDGYTERDNKCYKEVDKIDPIIELSCDDGYVLSTDKTSCEKTITKDLSISYICDSGYTLSDNQCSTTLSIDAVATYDCNGIGGTLSGSECIQRAADTQALVCNKYCLTGAYDYTIGKCKVTSPLSGTITYHDPVCNYSCKRGTLIGSMCYVDVATTANVTYSCSSGYTLSGTACYKNVVIEATQEQTCEEGYTLNNGVCEKLDIKEVLEIPKCNSKYELINNECIKYDIKEKE